MKNFYATLMGLTFFITTHAMEQEAVKTVSTDQKPIDIVFLGESSYQDAVWNYRVKKMEQAAQAFGAHFSYKFAEGDYKKHVQMIDEAVEKGAHAIIGPWWDRDMYKEAITKAISKGVHMYGFLSGRPHLSSDIGPDKFDFAEAQWHAYGRELAAIVTKMEGSHGTILWPTETFKGNYYTDALNAFKLFYKDKTSTKVNSPDIGRSVKRSEPKIENLEVGFNKSEAAKIIKNYLAQNSDIKTIITSGAIAITAASIAVKEMKKSSEEITLAGQVVSPESVMSVQEGYMPEGVNLELTNSSHNAIIDILTVLKLKAKPRHNPIEIEIITKENMAHKVPKELFPK